MTTTLPTPSGPDGYQEPAAVIPADQLFQGASVVLIEHQGVRYQLRITRNGKLILTK